MFIEIVENYLNKQNVNRYLILNIVLMTFRLNCNVLLLEYA